MSSLLRKMRRAFGQDDDFSIKTGDPIPCRSLLVRTFSTCAEQLPAGAEQWDVSGFLCEGEPFSRDTVKCWLNCGNCMVYGQGELDTEDQAQLSTAKGLQRVLAFAHAVDSPEGLLNAACSKLQELMIEVQLPERTLQLRVCPAHDCSYKARWLNDEYQLIAHTLARRQVIGCVSTIDQLEGIRQQIAVQTAALLQLAHALHLQPLLDAMQGYIFLSTRAQGSFLDGVLGQVFTDAVLQAALGSSTVSKETYISSVLTRPLSLVNTRLSSEGLLKPIGGFKVDPSTGKMTGDAQLLRDFLGAKAGQAVTVGLDLFAEDGLALGLKLSGESNTLTWLPARLLLGNSISDEELTLSV